MYLISPSIFCKQATCPSSELLASYCATDSATEFQVLIREHTAECDFCGAELQMLTKYPPTEEIYTPVEMPTNLRRLAESILSGRFLESKAFQAALLEKEGLTA